MTTQPRERTPQASSRTLRRRAARVTPRRDPAIWHGSTPYATPRSARPAAPQAARGGFGLSWRVVSGLIVVALIGLLVLLFTTDAFYVYGPDIQGLDYMTPNEVFAISGIANLHVFWVDPAEVRRSLLESPTIADARIEVGFGPPLVTIYVQERQPALAWEQAGVQVWLDVQGRVMRQRGTRPDLLRVQVATLVDGPPTGSIDSAIVAGALQLDQLLPDLQVLRYHPDYGLGYTDLRGAQVWFGTGTDMPEKILIYNAIIGNMAGNSAFARCAPPASIFVMNPDAPYCSTGN